LVIDEKEDRSGGAGVDEVVVEGREKVGSVEKEGIGSKSN